MQKNIHMKKIFYLLIFTLILFFTGCDYYDECEHHYFANNNYPRDTINKVLMLKIDYPTNKVEGAIEFIYDHQTDSFNIDIFTESFENYSTVSLIYRELNDTLFSGTIIPNGLGNMTFPEALIPAYLFDTVTTDDVVYPLNGFDHIPYENILQYTYYNLWLEVQKNVKVRQYLQSNPTQKVKFFLYEPYEGPWDYTKTDWYVFIKN